MPNLHGLVRVNGNAISDPLVHTALIAKRDKMLARENIPCEIIHEDMGYNPEMNYSWMNVTYRVKE